MNRKITLILFMIVMALVLGMGAQAQAATVIDMTLAGNTATTANGVIFKNDVSVVNVGTGNFDPFLTLSDKNHHGTAFVNDGIEMAYNTSGRVGSDAPMDADSTASREKDYLISNVPIVNMGGIDYYEFLLDINESGSAAGSLVSLDKVMLFLGSTGGATTETITPSLGTLIYNLNLDSAVSGNYAGTGVLSYLTLNAGLTSGSGAAFVDLGMYVPKSLFDQSGSSNTFLYLYTQLGVPDPADGGFEEWGVKKVTTAPPPPPVTTPEPASMALLGLGLAGLARLRRKI